MTKRIRGVLAPVVTPFGADLSADKERFIEHCQWLLSQNCGLAVFGTTSEANSLAAEERSTLLDKLVASGVDTARLMVGTGCCSITETVKLTAQAVTHGCAGVLMLPPFYYKGVSEEGLYRYFSEVVQRVGDPRTRIYLYHIPAVAAVGITPGLVERLLKSYPNAIAGMKDSSGDWNNTMTFLHAFAVRPRAGTKLENRNPPSTSSGPAGKSEGNPNLQISKAEQTHEDQTGFDVFVGSESFLLANMRNGGVGCISATANVNPAAIHGLYEACKELDRINRINRIGSDEDGKLAASPTDVKDQQQTLNVVRGIFAKYPMIAALKQGIAIYANDPAWAKVRPPLVELTAEQAKMLAAELRGIGFTMPGL